jgi:hypothetical protein
MGFVGDCMEAQVTARPFVVGSYIVAGIVGLFAWSSVQGLIDGLYKRLGTQEQTIIVQRTRIAEQDRILDRLTEFEMRSSDRLIGIRNIFGTIDFNALAEIRRRADRTTNRDWFWKAYGKR